jgi:hypothetical protein
MGFSWREIFLESPLVQDLVKERVQDMILYTIRRKFGAVPPEVESRIRGVKDREGLNTLNAQVGLSPDPDAFQAYLAAQ